MRLPRNIILICLHLLFSTPVWAQLRDTSLFTLYSKPFFYNVVKGEDGQIYAGTSEGIFQLKGAKLIKFDAPIGYLTLDSKGKPVIDSNGIKYHEQKSFLYLLPFPDEQRDVFHAGTDEHFYITAGGKMHVYEIHPYAYIYRNHSVRTVSRNFTGTYSGIYYKGKKLEYPFPKFSDGRIREFNGKAFICYSDLKITNTPEGDSLPLILTEVPKGFNYDYISDIWYSERLKRYFMATRTQMGSMDKELTQAKTLYTIGEKEGDVVLLGEDRSKVIFASGNRLMSFISEDEKFSSMGNLPEQIMDGHLGTLNYYLLGSNGLYSRRADGKIEKLVDLYKAHSIAVINNTEIVIATDAGLFLFNATTQKLSDLIKGVEFNRWGLHLDQDKLYAGSINGLYILDTKNLGALSELVNTKNKQTEGLPSYMLAIMAALVTISILLAFLLIRSRRRLNRIIKEVAAAELPETTKEDIEQFIRENLAIASLKSIADHFKTKTSTIYTILDPEKPGAFIQQLRLEKVMEMRKDKTSAKEIAAITGFSESYVRKIWNQKD
jgi:hypothetical protein